MKREVTEYVALCDVCRRVKAEHLFGFISSTDRWADLKNQPDIRRYVESLRNTICIKMSPFRALYGRRCGTPLHWDQWGFVVWSRNHRRRRTTISPIRGLRRFKVKGKLAPRYIGPFKIIDRKGEVAYQPEFSDRLSGVHDVFHVSRLKKCASTRRALREDELNVRDDLTYTNIRSKFWRRRERTTETGS
ncbi:hypothetical protein U9M48_029079 [Paspalum notatum var. saurae]|uniref:Tf2-1-like SH3-like domain-containing protein n=1 Tax=Paspalum notatum var. saurae TaxID=547442 RepID=A0AAQ3U2I9_PASNO